MKKMNMALATAMLTALVGCSSGPTAKDQVKDQDISQDFKKEFTVIDASSNLRPGWITDAPLWASEQKLNTEKNLFFSFETGPRVNRELACDVAKANARAEVAAQLATFIKKSLSQTMEGQDMADPAQGIAAPLNSYIESNLVQKIQEVVVGAAVVKTHWEKRFYQQKLGAEKDYRGVTCAALVQIDREQVQDSIALIKRELMNRTGSTDLKQKVKVALEKAEKDFEVMRGLPAASATETAAKVETETESESN